MHRYADWMPQSNRSCLSNLRLTGTLFCHTVEVNAPSFGTPRLFLAPAQAAILCRGVNIAFRHFIPPLLLCRRPDFFLAAAGARERRIHIKPAVNVIRSSIAVVRREQLLVYPNGSERSRCMRSGPVRLGLFRSTCRPPCFDFVPALLTAFHNSV